MIKGLANLKGKPMYEGISVTEDYTLSERSIIKKWAQKAKERNAKEPSDSNIINGALKETHQMVFISKRPRRRETLQTTIKNCK